MLKAAKMGRCRQRKSRQKDEHQKNDERKPHRSGVARRSATCKFSRNWQVCRAGKAVKRPLLLPHLLYQRRRRRLQRPGDVYQVQHGDIALAALYRADVSAVGAGFGQP